MAAIPIADQHLYEVGVRVADDDFDYTYEVDHRFPALPDVDTLKALKDEATAAFEQLHPGVEIGQVDVRCLWLSAEERDDGGDSTDREHAAA